MSRMCAICGKGVIYGKSGIHKHSGQWRYRAPKTTRQWKPNLRQVKIMLEGRVQKVKVCAQCLKSTNVMGAEKAEAAK